MPTSRAADKVGSRQTLAGCRGRPAGGPPPGVASRFGSFANTVQTRMDTSAGTNGTLGGTLQAQVERALAQVLRQPGAIGSNGAGAMATAAGAAGTAPALAPQQAALVRETRLVGGDLTSTLDTLRPLSTFADPGDVAALRVGYPGRDPGPPPGVLPVDSAAETAACPGPLRRTDGLEPGRTSARGDTPGSAGRDRRHWVLSHAA